MSPAKKADLAAAHTVLPVSVPLLATVLDLPNGTEVVSAVVQDDQLLLTLSGVAWDGVRGWEAKRGAKTPERITAEYSVDAHGHRSLTTLAITTESDAGGITDAGDDPEPDQLEEKE